MGKIDGSAVITGKSVVFGSGDGRIYMVNMDDGKKIWSYEIGSPISSTPAVVKNMIVIAAEDGRIYAFGN